MLRLLLLRRLPASLSRVFRDGCCSPLLLLSAAAVAAVAIAIVAAVVGKQGISYGQFGHTFNDRPCTSPIQFEVTRAFGM